MVRFHWHVEDGSGASIPHGGMTFYSDTAVQHINCNIEIPGEPHAQACITVPRGYLSEGKVKEIGILLGHDTPESWDGPLLTGIAVALAEAGKAHPCCQVPAVYSNASSKPQSSAGRVWYIFVLACKAEAPFPVVQKSRRFQALSQLTMPSTSTHHRPARYELHHLRPLHDLPACHQAAIEQSLFMLAHYANLCCVLPIQPTFTPVGHVVVRYHSDGKELRRQRLFEKALDVCATSPFARFVQRWVLAGVGHGARLAAVVGSRARGTVCGYVFVSYPVAVSGWKVVGLCSPGLGPRLSDVSSGSLLCTCASQAAVKLHSTCHISRDHMLVKRF